MGMKYAILMILLSTLAHALVVTLDPYSGIDYSKANVYSMNEEENECYCPDYDWLRY